MVKKTISVQLTGMCQARPGNEILAHFTSAETAVASQSKRSVQLYVSVEVCDCSYRFCSLPGQALFRC